MTAFAAAEITKDRLKLWQRRNQREGIPCTPAVLVNVRHDGSGQIVLNMTEDLPLDKLHALLVAAAEETAKEMRKGN